MHQSSARGVNVPFFSRVLFLFRPSGATTVLWVVVGRSVTLTHVDKRRPEIDLEVAFLVAC